MSGKGQRAPLVILDEAQRLPEPAGTADPPTLPPPYRFATYKGDVSEVVGRQVFGPNTMGEFWGAVSAEYPYQGEDKTRLGFVIVRPPGQP